MNPHLDYRKFIALMLPTFLRGARTLSVMRSLVQPLVGLSDRRLAQRESTLFELRHTGQVCYLKDALNNYFGFNYSNGFEIEDITAEGDFLFAYDETDLLSTRHWIIADEPDCDIIHDEDIITVATKSFVVLVPVSVYGTNQMPIVRKIVEKYRLVSRLPFYKLKN